jgi:tetratricopeptide (TPR) repeat protein
VELETAIMAQTGRNAPCPCGSGKKYKRCCLEKDEAAALAKADGAREAARSRARAEFDALADDDDLDGVSNAVVDMVRAGKLDEAEAAARDLLTRFPEVHDGYDRLGMVCEARGDKKQAALYYRKVVEFARQRPDNYDPEIADNFQNLADRLDPPAGT